MDKFAKTAVIIAIAGAFGLTFYVCYQHHTLVKGIVANEKLWLENEKIKLLSQIAVVQQYPPKKTIAGFQQGIPGNVN